MNKKAAEGITMGLIFMAFIAVIVGLVLFQAASTEVGRTDVTRVVNNVTVTVGTVGVWQDLVGQELLDTPVVTNHSVGDTIPSNNYTIAERVSSVTGVKTIGYRNLGTNTNKVNVTYTYGADGYVEDSGAKAIVGLTLIFTALAVAVVALIPTLRSGVLEMMGR